MMHMGPMDEEGIQPTWRLVWVLVLVLVGIIGARVGLYLMKKNLPPSAEVAPVKAWGFQAEYGGKAGYYSISGPDMLTVTNNPSQDSPLMPADDGGRQWKRYSVTLSAWMKGDETKAQALMNCWARYGYETMQTGKCPLEKP